MADRLSYELSDAYERYFERLSLTGGSGKEELKRLLVVDFIDDIVTSDMSMFICEKDKKTITRVLDCIRGNSCLFDLDSHDMSEDIFSGKEIGVDSLLTDHRGRYRKYGRHARTT